MQAIAKKDALFNTDDLLWLRAVIGIRTLCAYDFFGGNSIVPPYLTSTAGDDPLSIIMVIIDNHT